MGHTLAQTPTGVQNASSASATTITYTSSTTSGNKLVIAAIINGGTNPTLSISDNKGNSFTQSGTLNFTAGNTREYIWHCDNCTGGASHTITLTPSAAGFISAAIMEFGGGAAASSQDGTAASVYSSGGTTTPTTSSLTVSQANDLIVGILTHNSSVTALTPGASYTQAFENENATNMPINVEYDLDVDANQAADWTMGAARGDTGALAAAFKEAAAGDTLMAQICL